MPEAAGRHKAEVPAIVGMEENGDHFLVHYADGKSAQVLKTGLKPDTLAYIQGMAGGGMVIGGGAAGGIADLDEPALTEVELHEARRQGDSEGVELPPSTHSATSNRGPEATGSGDADIERPVRLADGGMVAPDAGLAQTQFAPIDPLTGMPVAGAGMPMAPVFAPVDIPMEPTPLQRPDPLFPSMRPGAAEATAAVDAGSPYGKPPTEGMLDVTGRKADAVAPLPSNGSGGARLAPAPALPRLPGVGGSGALTEINKGLALQEAGIAAQVEVAKARDAAVLVQQDEHIKRMQGLEAQHAERMAMVQKRADDLFQATLNAKIDPNRVWSSAGVGNRIAAGIGILLSGIGQGLAGGPNMALAVIDKTIDRDIEAQRDNLERQKGLLSYYLQQGRDMQSAHELAKADLKDMLAAQLTRVSAEFGGAEAAARAQVLLGQLRTETAEKRQVVMARDFAMAKDRLSTELEMQRNHLLASFMAAPRGPAGGVAAPAQILDLLPKDVRERSVRLPDGSIGFAPDAERARKATQAMQVADEMRRTLQRYGSLLEKGHPVLPSGVGGDRAAAKATRADLMLKLKELNGLGALQAYEIDLLEPLIPDITEVFTRDATHKQGLGVLGKTIDDKILSNLKTMVQ